MTRKDYGLLAAVLFLTVGLSGCGGGGSNDGGMMSGDGSGDPLPAVIEAAGPDPARLETIMGVETGSKFLAMGARSLSGAEIRAELVEKTLGDIDVSWTWDIRDDQTAPSRANDGSWTNTSIWEIRNEQYCRGLTMPDACSTVYELDGVYRFGDAPTEGDELAAWGVVIL